MNKTDFKKEMFEALNSYSVDLKFVSSWYQEIVNSLKLIKSKSAKIKHPRHLGDFLENELISILRKLLPQRYLIDKGFLINNFSAFSQEQDILIVDTSLGSAICKTDATGYYPIESVLSSIEVKSNLDLAELRKCFVSCASAKKLPFPAFNFDDSPDKRLFYSIFAYTSSCKQKSFQAELDLCLDLTPETLRPNLIYILDQGLYFPTKSGTIYLDLETIQKVEEGYRIIQNNTNPEAESQNLYLLLSMIIEHTINQSNLRKPVNYSSYSLMPTMWRASIEKNRDTTTPIKKFINKYTRWSSEHGGELLVIYEETCPECKVSQKFYTLPPGTKKARTKLVEDFREQGCVPLPKSKKFTCGCGKSYEVKEE